MAVTATPAFVQTPKIGVVQCVNADGTSAKTVVTAGANGSKIVSLTATSDDTSARIFRIGLVRSATTYVLATINIPIASGTDGTAAAVDMMSIISWPGQPLDNDGQRYFFLQSGDTLTVTLTTGAVTAAKTVSFAANYGDF